MTYPNTQLFINGQWCDAAAGESLAVFNPATGKEIGRVAHARIPDLDRALHAAQKGFETWRSMLPIERNKIMRKAAALMRERAGDIAAMMTQEQGKPLAEAKVEAMAAADIIEWFADEGMRVYGRIVPSRFNLSARQMVIKDPVGPVAAFTPWNFPINQVVRKMAAALASGCSMIVKAPEETPAAPAALIRAFVDAGIPEGVLGLVYLHRLHARGQAIGRTGWPAHEARHHGAGRPRPGDRGRRRRHFLGGEVGRCGQVPQCGPGVHCAHPLFGAREHQERICR